MHDTPEARIRRQSPQARRRRRRAQQQSACCGCFLVVACVFLGVIALRGPISRWREHRQDVRQLESQHQNEFPVEIATDAPAYYRYALVGITVKLSDPRKRPLETDDPPQVFVSHEGEFIDTVGGVDRLTPRYDSAKKMYTCRWPIPWNAPPGRYAVETRYELQHPEAWPWETVEEQLRRERGGDGDADEAPIAEGEAFCVARSFFQVRARKPAEFPVGMCAATWEETLPADGLRMRKPSGQMGGWQAIFDWCELIGADTLWVRGALTHAGTEKLTMDAPFLAVNLRRIPRMAAEAHRRGLKFGVWAMAYATLPKEPSSNARKPAYEFAKDISRATGAVEETAFVSLRDQRRIQHLIEFFKAMQADPNVDHIGLDYMRTWRGYELVDRFAREMPVELPPDWSEMDQAARWKYVARRVEPDGCFEHRDFWDSWNWYRAHLGAGIVAKVIRESEVKKPVWVFALSWKHGVEHGQDPLMFNDAGATMLAQMLYQTDRRLFNFMLRDWPGYVKAGQANLVCGDQVDHPLHEGLGPLELYKRMVEAHEGFVGGGRTQGAFWHDISRAAIRGRLGPYPGSEWALAGGAAFSKVRETWRVYPISANLVAAASATVDVPFRVQLNIENIGEKAVRRIRIKPMETEGIELRPSEPVELAELAPGHIHAIPFTAKITRHSPARKNGFMAAFRITWPTGSYGGSVRNDLPRVIIVMDYVRGE